MRSQDDEGLTWDARGIDDQGHAIMQVHNMRMHWVSELRMRSELWQMDLRREVTVHTMNPVHGRGPVFYALPVPNDPQRAWD